MLPANCLSVFDHFVGLALNPLQPGVAFLYPLKYIRIAKGFLMFLGSIEKQHRAVMR